MFYQLLILSTALLFRVVISQTGGETTINDDECPLVLACCDEDCCGEDTVWSFGVCSYVPGSSDFRFPASPEYTPGCVLRECCLDDCCGFLTRFDETIDYCVPDILPGEEDNISLEPTSSRQPSPSPTATYSPSDSPPDGNGEPKTCVIVYTFHRAFPASQPLYEKFGIIKDGFNYQSSFENIPNWRNIQATNQVVTWYYLAGDFGPTYCLFDPTKKNKWDCRVDRPFAENPNSKAAFQSFVKHALQDCKTKKTKELLIILEGIASEKGIGSMDAMDPKHPDSPLKHSTIASTLNEIFSKQVNPIQDDNKVVIGFNVCYQNNKKASDILSNENRKEYNTMSEFMLVTTSRKRPCEKWSGWGDDKRNAFNPGVCAIDMAKGIRLTHRARTKQLQSPKLIKTSDGKEVPL